MPSQADAVTYRAVVVGAAVSRSLSPAIFAHLAAIEGRSIDYGALGVTAEAFAQQIARLLDDGYIGANVTIPYKADAAALADERSDDVKLLDAANVLHFRGRRIVAHNTDVGGFGAALAAANVSFARQSGAVVYGAGGAAAAVVLACARAGARRIAIVNRTAERAERLALSLQPHLASTELSAPRGDSMADVALYANATPAGNPFQAPACRDAAAIDLTYRPRVTPFMEAAQAHGLRATNGIWMLVEQAIATYEIWFGALTRRGAIAHEIYREIEESA